MRSYKLTTLFYLIESPNHSEKYIGLTTRTLKQRFNEHKKSKDWIIDNTFSIKEIDRIEHNNIYNLDDYLSEKNIASKTEINLISVYSKQCNLKNISNGGEWGLKILWQIKQKKWVDKYGNVEGFIKYKQKENKLKTWLNNWINHRKTPILKVWLRNWINHRNTPVLKTYLRNWINSKKTPQLKTWLIDWVKHRKTPILKVWLRSWAITRKTPKLKTWLRNWIFHRKTPKLQVWLNHWIGNKKTPILKTWLINWVIIRKSHKLKIFLRHWISGKKTPILKTWLKHWIFHRKTSKLKTWLRNWINHRKPSTSLRANPLIYPITQK